MPLFNTLNINKKYRSKLHKITEVYCKDEYDEDTITEIIKMNFNMMRTKEL